MFCDRLKTARINAKMSQREVAEKIGISQTSYSFLESGLREPSMLYLRRIAALLNVSIDWLCDNHPDEEELVLAGNKKYCTDKCPYGRRETMKKVTVKSVFVATGRVLWWILVHAFCGALWLIGAILTLIGTILVPWVW